MTEKFDGSFIEFGLDKDGHFYTRRKGDEVYYDVEEWPDMPWTNGFRSAHVNLENLSIALRENGYLKPGETYGVEIIYGQRPNTIHYQGHYDTLVVTRYPESIIRMGLLAFLNECKSYASSSRWVTRDGRELKRVMDRREWDFYLNPEHRYHNYDHNTRGFLEWIQGDSKLGGVTRLELLTCKLNRKPAFISEETWKSGAAMLKIMLRNMRDELQETYKHKVLELKHQYMNAFLNNVGSRSSEGFVVVPDNGPVYKVVNRDVFARANLFSHWVRYCLQGGRRPARPCFLSRTKDWPVEKRLARLEQLRQRYIRRRVDMLWHREATTVRYTEDLDQRTLLLFAELKVRIRDGWQGV